MGQLLERYWKYMLRQWRKELESENGKLLRWVKLQVKQTNLQYRYCGEQPDKNTEVPRKLSVQYRVDLKWYWRKPKEVNDHPNSRE